MPGFLGRIPGPGQGGAATPPLLWDPLIRLSHWTIAGVVIANGLLLKPGGVPHLWLGWIALAVLALRLLWGLIGPTEARLTSFLPNPVAAMSHLADLVRGRPRHYPSHNPAGALMVWALWALLAVVLATGLTMTEGKTPWRLAEEKAAVAAGDWSVLVLESDEGDEDGEESEVGEMLEEVHELAANLMLVLALLHVAGVAVESRLMRRNLLRAMTIGPGSTPK